MILAGSGKEGLSAEVYQDLAVVNNELVNALRDALKTRGRSTPPKSDVDLDEFAQLNNELVTTQRQLAKSNRRLKALNDQKNELLGIAAHDLRNPLGVISGYIKFALATGGSLPEPQRQMLEKAIQTSDKMLTMLEELLDISQIESGKLRLVKSRVDMTAMVAEVVDLNRVIADRKSIVIEYSRVEPLWIDVDAGKVEQVINNLVSNAIKYSHSNTHVTVILEADGDGCCLRVSDQGQGIPEKELDKLFKPFAKTSVKSTAGERSTGLGLAITRKIIEGHKGLIEVDSTVGKGSTFTVRFPGPAS